MTAMQEAAEYIARIFRFEFWLRFYFVQEIDGALRLVLSEEEMKKLAKYSPWDELAEDLQGKDLDPQLCQTNLSTFLNRHYDGRQFVPGMVARVLDSRELEEAQEVFMIWIQAHEHALEQKIWDFDYWDTSFSLWKKSDTGQQVLLSTVQPESDVLN